MNCPTCAHTSRRPHYLSGAGRERNPTRSPGPGKATPVGFRFSFLAVPLVPQLQATTHGVHAAQPNTAPQPRWTEEVERNVLGSE